MLNSVCVIICSAPSTPLRHETTSASSFFCRDTTSRTRRRTGGRESVVHHDVRCPMSSSTVSLIRQSLFFSPVLFCHQNDVMPIPEGPVYLDTALDPPVIDDISFVKQLDAIVANVEQQMSADRKSGALKQLQGHIWKKGYEEGSLLGEFYEDAYTGIRAWHRQGLRVCIYSSGSVEAQKLIFGYTKQGSLLPLIEQHFDTAVGHKQQVASYRTISDRLKVEPSCVLFATDVLAEAQAAHDSGMHAVILVREGNAPVSNPCAFPLIHSFDELELKRG